MLFRDTGGGPEVAAFRLEVRGRGLSSPGSSSTR
jgi:hypothetical protein